VRYNKLSDLESEAEKYRIQAHRARVNRDNIEQQMDANAAARKDTGA